MIKLLKNANSKSKPCKHRWKAWYPNGVLTLRCTKCGKIDRLYKGEK